MTVILRSFRNKFTTIFLVILLIIIFLPSTVNIYAIEKVNIEKDQTLTIIDTNLDENEVNGILSNL